MLWCNFQEIFMKCNVLKFCPMSFCIPRTNLSVTPGVSWLPTFAFQAAMMKVKVLEGLGLSLWFSNAGDLGSIPGLERSHGVGKVYPLQYPGLENSMDCIVYGVAKSWTRLSNFHSLTHCINAQDTWMQGKGDRAAVKPQDSNYWVENSFGFFVRVYEKNLKEFFG